MVLTNKYITEMDSAKSLITTSQRDSMTMISMFPKFSLGYSDLITIEA